MFGDTAPHVVVSDAHYPFESKRCIKLALQCIRDVQPAAVHVLGDWIDCYSISRFSRDPRRGVTLAKEIKRTRGGLEELCEAAPGAAFYYSEGNHENRLDRFLVDRAPELLGLDGLDLPSLLGLGDLGIKYHTLLDPYKVGHLRFYHGSIVRKHSGATAHAHVDMFGCSVIHGHTHRQGAYFRTSMNATHGGFENGCLCAPPHYMTAPNWQRGFSVVWFDGPLFHVELVPIINGRYVFHGKAYGTSNTQSARKTASQAATRVSRARKVS